MTTIWPGRAQRTNNAFVATPRQSGAFDMLRASYTENEIYKSYLDYKY
jgi:hypothetical protein